MTIADQKERVFVFRENCVFSFLIIFRTSFCSPSARMFFIWRFIMSAYETLYNTSIQFVTENQLNAFKILEWRKILDANAFDICSYDKLILYFSVNIFQEKLGFSSVDSPRFLKYLEKELYNTLSDKENRGKIDQRVLSENNLYQFTQLLVVPYRVSQSA